MNSKVRETAIQVISLEAGSINDLQHFVNEDFVNAVDIIHQSGGRVVVSGIGKSAIVGQKIVATFNSTGTPALFMHAGDAIHGDLGMVQQNDVVLLISKSGESSEIKVLIPLIRSFKNKIIGMVGNASSYLAKNADAFINASVSREACPNNLAPTSSTTAQMVLGDALAICLMELNGFSDYDFARYHPGGILGKKMYLRVKDVYTLNEKPCVFAHASLKDLIIEITRGRVGAAAVIASDKKVSGIITDGDIRRLLETTDEIKNLHAGDICKPNPKTILPDTLAIEALEKMKKFDINQLLVCDKDDYYLGVIHLHDLIREGII